MQSGGGRLFALLHPVPRTRWDVVRRTRRSKPGEIKAARVSSLIDRSVPDSLAALSLRLWGKWTSAPVFPDRVAAEAVMKDVVGSVLLNDPNAGFLDRKN